MLDIEKLAAIYGLDREAAGSVVREFEIKGRKFAFNSQPSIMGVINLSADSWYRESVCLSAEAAVKRARVLFSQGAEIIDIGAESTLAQAARVGGGQQKSMLLPVLEGLRDLPAPVSVETYSAEVARSCLAAGATVLNLTGLADAGEMYRLAVEHGAAVIICYVQGANVREVGDFKMGEDAVGMMYEYFAREVEEATKAGLEKIFIDPGLGFYYRNLQDSAVRVRHQMKTFLNTFRLRKLGFPICHALPHAFEFFGEEVRCAEPFFAVLASIGKTDLFRTHEVPRVKAVLDTLSIF